MSDPYAAAPISRHDSSHEFRLVELQPSTDSDHIKCQLRSYTLDESCPKYTALSYAWGSDVNPNIIDVNGVSFPVGRSLWSFLYQMRLNEQHGVYWIDAICIDQKSVLERNHQVQMMQEIYSEAQSVAVWLGEVDDSSSISLAMDFLATRTRFEPGSTDYGKFWTQQQSESILELCHRNYWKRMWIIQELLLAKEATIHWGPNQIEWNAFENLVWDLEKIRHQPASPENCLEVLQSPAAHIITMKFSSDPRARRLKGLLQKYSDQEATNTLDKVYALIGLANDPTKLTVDYQILPEDLLVQLLHHVCKNSETWVREEGKRRQLMTFGEMMAEVLKVDWCKDEVMFQIKQVAETYQLEEADEPFHWCSALPVWSQYAKASIRPKRFGRSRYSNSWL
jgi:hypothetical protein